MSASNKSDPNSGQGYFVGLNGQHVEIRDVWAHNLEEEMEKVREIVEKYPYVAMVSVIIFISISIITIKLTRILNFLVS